MTLGKRKNQSYASGAEAIVTASSHCPLFQLTCLGKASAQKGIKEWKGGGSPVEFCSCG